MDYKALMLKKLRSYPRRVSHTLNVLERALELGKIYNASLEVLETAALLHDVTKYYTKEEHLSLIKDESLIKDYDESLHHSISAYYLAKEIGVTNIKILEAIRYHIWGKINMSIETMILVVSDYTEKDRSFKEAKIAYELAKEDLIKSYLYVMEETIKYLIKNNISPHKEQIKVYNYYKEKYKGEINARENS